MNIFADMSRYNITFEQSVARLEKGKGLFKSYEDNCDRMSDHLRKMMLLCHLSFEQKRAHVFNYLSCCAVFMKKKIFDIGEIVIPVAEPADIQLLKDRIQGQKWDIEWIQSILFDAPLDYSHEQIWDLSTTTMEHYQRDPEVRSLAFMMGEHTRVGEDFPLSQLDPLLLRQIVTWSL